MFRALALIPFLALAACETPDPAAQAAIREAAIANSANLVQSKITPGLQACLAYARTGTLDTATLARAGYTGPRMALGRPAYDGAQNLFLVINENRNRCRLTWNFVPRADEGQAALRATLANAGFVQSGRDGDLLLYSNGTSTIAAQGTFTFSQGFTALDFIFERR